MFYKNTEQILSAKQYVYKMVVFKDIIGNQEKCHSVKFVNIFQLHIRWIC